MVLTSSSILSGVNFNKMERIKSEQMKESLLWQPHPSHAPMPRFSQFISSSCWVMHCYCHSTNNYRVCVWSPEHPGKSNHVRWIHRTASLVEAQWSKLSVSTLDDYYVIPLWRGLPPSYCESIEFDTDYLIAILHRIVFLWYNMRYTEDNIILSLLVLQIWI
jgi:hypothetical protein